MRQKKTTRRYYQTDVLLPEQTDKLLEQVTRYTGKTIGRKSATEQHATTC